MKKLVSISLMVSVCIFLIATSVGASSQSFNDVPQSRWSYEDVQYLKDRGIAEAVVNNQFKPGEDITRAKAARMLVKALGVTPSNNNVSAFPDVPNNHPDLSYINKSEELGIFDGYVDGSFRPNQTLSRAEMAKVIVKTFNLTGQYPKGFSDVPTSHWAKKDISTLAASEVTFGIGKGLFGPSDKTTREQLSAFIVRAMKGSPFADKNLHLYTSTDNYKVENGMMYVDVDGKWTLPKENLISNQTLMAVAKTLLDEERYVYIKNEKPDGTRPNNIVMKSAYTDMAADFGNVPIEYLFFNETKRYYEDAGKSYDVSLRLSYSWYDLITDQHNSIVYENKLKDSLIALYGQTKGKQIGDYILSHYKTTRKNKPGMHENSYKYSKTFGQTTVDISAGSSAFYVKFSN